MDQCSDTGYTHSDNGKDRNPSEQTNFPYEKNSLAFYALSSAHCTDSTGNGYHETHSAAAVVQNSASGCSHSEHGNQVHLAKRQDFDVEGSSPASSEQLSLQIPTIPPALYRMSQSPVLLEQHSAVGFSQSEHDKNIHSLQRSGLEQIIPTFYEQSYVHFNGINHGVHPLPETVLPSFQDVFGKSRQQENTDGRKCNNNYILQPELSPLFECCIQNNDKGEIARKETDKIPLFEKRMETCCGNEITQKNGGNSASNSAWLQNSHTVKQHEGLNLDNTFQNVNVTNIFSNMTNKEDNGQVASTTKDPICLSFSIEEAIQNGEIAFRESIGKFYCRTCNSLLSKSNLVEHWRRKHTLKTIKCAHCDKMFSEPIHLKQHERKHLENYACDKCEYQTCWKGHFERHVKRHLEEAPFACDICKQAFQEKIDLTYHLNQCHSNPCPSISSA